MDFSESEKNTKSFMSVIDALIEGASDMSPLSESLDGQQDNEREYDCISS